MVIDQLVFPENHHFSLNHYISISVSQIFSNKVPPEIVMVCCTKKCLCFSKFFLNLFLLHLKVKLGQISREKSYFELFFWHYRRTKHIFQYLRHYFVTTFLLFETNPSPSICCWWLSSFRTSKFGYKVYFE